MLIEPLHCARRAGHPLAVIPLALAVLVWLPTSVARAELVLCNETGTSRSVAIGYGRDGTWVSEGWWTIPVGDCQRVISQDLSNRYYYYRATDRSGDFDGEGYMFCTDRQAFTIVGDDDCARRGYRRESFRKIDTGPTARAFTVTMTAADGAQSASKSAAARPGTHGEPLSVTGIFRGCGRVDGVLSCSIEADGWTYAVVDDGRTPKSLLHRLDRMPMNQRVHLQGDLVTQGDVTIEVTARAIEVVGHTGNPSAGLHTALIGAWQSLDDPAGSIAFIAGGGYESYHAGDLLEQGWFDVADRCPGGPVTGETVLVTGILGDPEPLCFGIDAVPGDHLTLIALPRGNLLRYVRLAR